MQITGIICEYNPFHLGHQKQLDHIRRTQGPNEAIVCLMSGNFVQRGHPAVFDKTVRAKAAILCGADLVLELPVHKALSSAEGFAAGGVEILSRLCDKLCFGAETDDHHAIASLAGAMLEPAFTQALRTQLDKGLSFPAARQAALKQMGLPAALLETPNNILAVEYCKAIYTRSSKLIPMPIVRQGSYHDDRPDPENPSATSLRRQIETGGCWMDYIPKKAQPVVADSEVHTLSHGETAMLYRLRTMTDADFEVLPFGSEGLWRKFMHASRTENSLEAILTATKSKRYTRTRLDRMAMCAFLGLTARDMDTPIPYVRVLAFNDKGRAVLGQVRDSAFFINLGADTRHPYQALERRCGSLYGLFAKNPEPPKSEENSRIFYAK